MLHQQYCEGLGLLKNREFQKGCDVLLGILQHPLTKDCDLDGLRFSTFMSLAEVQEVIGDARASLGFYWQALQIL